MLLRDIPLMDFDGFDEDRDGLYLLLNNNCQHYVRDIINMADQWAQKRGEALTF